MVASMAQAAAASYYLESQRSFRHPTEYYTAGEEPDGVWFNPNDLLGLADGEKIDSKHFHRLYHGFAPETGGKLTRNAGSENRSPGLDITFSADKSVSALWAIADSALRGKIEEAHNAASRSALQEVFLKECSYTRTRVGGAQGQIQVLPAHLLGAMFQHGTSRANDPQLHTHCVVFNAVQTESDGQWRALHQKPLYRWIKAAGACYRSYLASNLSELGIKIERYGKDNAYVRIKHIPKELEKAWSKRRSEIVETAAELGFDTADNSNRATMVNLMTRERKRGDQDPEQRHTRWRHECEQLFQCATLVASVFEEKASLTPDRIREWAERLDELPHVLTRLQAVFRTPDLAEAIYNLHEPELGTLHPETIESAIQRIIRNPDLVALDREPRTPESIAGLSYTVPLSTRHTLEMEQETRDLALTMLQQSRFAIPAPAIEQKLQELIADDYPLSDEQTSAIRHVTGKTGAISIIEGAAGSGKTTTMRPIVDLYKQHGYNLIATSIAWRIAVDLANDCDIPPLATDRLLQLASRGKLHLDQKSVIVVEEAGMFSTRHTHRLLKLAQERGAKVIFLGDTQQQQPIEAGPGLRLIHDVTGSHRVDTIRRQLPDAEDFLRDVYGLDPHDAIAQAARLSAEDRREILRNFDRTDPQSHVKAWQITASRDFKDGNAKDAIEAYRLRGRIHLRSNPDATISKLVDDWHDFVTDNPNKSCVVLARTHQEIKLLSLQMRERLHADQQNSKSAVVTVSRGEGKKREYYDLEIRTGDVLRIGASNLDKKVFTGSLLTVENLSIRGAPFHHEPRVMITARDERGRRLTFYHDEIRDYHGNIRLDHGFALTMTSAQGLTVDRAFVLTDDAPARETIYPAATRHRERLDFYVSREGPLSKIKVNLPDQGAAQQEPITDDDIFEHLAKRWSRHQPKEAATDYTSEELLQEALATIRPSNPTAPKATDTELADDTEEARSHHHSRQAPVNDNASSLMAWATRQLRRTALDLRYGNTVALISQGRREVMTSYDDLRERARKEGAGVALSAEYGNTLFRQAQVLAAAEPFRRDPERFRDLLQRRGGLEPQDLDKFAAQYGRAREAQRTAERAADRKKSVSETAPLEAEVIDYETAKAALPEHAGKRQTRSLPRAAELSAELSARVTDVCEHYLPNGKRQGDYWQVSAGEDETSLRVNLSGANRGKWQDTSKRTRGDLLDLIRHVKQYGSIGEAMKDATSFLQPEGAVHSLQPASTSSDEQAAQAGARARALYERSAPIRADDAAGRYLAKLGLDIQDAAELRYNDRVFYLVGDDLRRSPAILAPLTAEDGSVRSLQRLLLTADGDALAADPHDGKSHAAAPSDAATWFGNRGASHVALCPSIPDALTLLRVLGPKEREQLAVAALPDTCDFAQLPVPPESRRVFLMQPAGPDADRAWQAFQDRHADSGLKLGHILAGEAGLNALLQEKGPEAVRNLLQPLTEALGEREAIAVLDRWRGDWNRHVKRAIAAHANAFYMTGHEDLIERLRRLRNQPAVAALPGPELDHFDAILGESRRQSDAVSTVKRHIAQVKPCLDELSRLERAARSQDTDLLQLPSYPEWRAAAERLLSEAQAIAADRNAFGPCLDHTFMAWKKVHDGIRDLAVALGHPTDSLLHRQPELYLQPIPRALPILDETLEADARYRRLREQWHKHVAGAEADKLHPYDLRSHSPLVDAMRELRDRQGLHATARRSLDTMLSHHGQFLQARAGIEHFRLDWQRHLDRATAAHAHPFYLSGHRTLIERLGQVREEPAFAALPAPEQERLAAILDQDRRQAAAVSTVQRYIARIEPCLDNLRDLEKTADSRELPLADVPSYDRWRDTAEPLLAEGQSIADDRETYGPCLDHTFRAWKKVHEGVRDLAGALGHPTDSLRHRQPELYLQPVTLVDSSSDKLNKAAASYRRLREQWHNHIALAEEHRLHPYRVDGYSSLIDAMRDVRELPGLEFDARYSLDAVLAHHGQFHEARTDIERHLDQADQALHRLATLKEIAEQLSSPHFQPEDMTSYATSKETALQLVRAGQDILADRQRYGIHLEQNPDLAMRIRANIRDINRQLSPKTPPAPHQQTQETLQQTKTQTIRRSRGIKP